MSFTRFGRRGKADRSRFLGDINGRNNYPPLTMKEDIK